MANNTGIKFGGRTKGTPNKKTVIKAELRKEFEERMAKNWDDLIVHQQNDAKKNWKARHYIFDQVIGKPQESIDLTSGGEKVSGVVFLPKKNE